MLDLVNTNVPQLPFSDTLIHVLAFNLTVHTGKVGRITRVASHWTAGTSLLGPKDMKLTGYWSTGTPAVINLSGLSAAQVKMIFR
jgi:hypothetical protein